VKLWAKAAMREPMPNNRAAMRINYEVLALMNVVEEGLEKSHTSFLPNVWLKPQITGWTTAEAMRNEVPDQKASMAVP
jgi:hypothetical protein